MLFRVAEGIGGKALGATRSLGRMGVFLAVAVRNAVVPPYRGRDILKQIHFIGVKSLFVIVLTAIFDVVGICGGYLVGVKLLGLDAGRYFGQMRTSVELADVVNGVWKSLAFSLLIVWVCAFKGFFTERGAEGVSRATTSAVVISSVLVLVGQFIHGSAK